ncbi:MAG: class I adenylate cyclase [Deltaproteobacteria bacterium]|jgi:adenylate cyclase class 1|nr:class I adenylate cyclase [Deltaproteobacteria bacterium]
MTEPTLSKSVVQEATLKQAFPFQIRNNHARIRDLRSLATPGFRRTFDLTPTLLHYNHPELPGYFDHPNAPHGLLFYEDWLKRGQVEDQGSWVGTPVNQPVVECLVLIGSSGTVGQTAESDLDYWVCYNPARLNGERLAMFHEKLAVMTEWAMRENKTEANFYPIDLSDLVEGRLNSLSDKRDGDVAPMLLIEELFRTMLFVGGRLPLWCFWPLDRPESEYREVAKDLAPLDWEKEAPIYVDLGFPSKPRPQEYLASAMWLTCKSQDNPFKGLLKIMPILEAVEMNFASPLLCDVVKERILNHLDAETSVDPYIISVDWIIDFVSRSLSPQQLTLVEEAAFLKVLGSSVGCSQSLAASPTDPKCRVLTKWLGNWRWSQEKLNWLRNYENWPNSAKLDHAQELIKLLFSCYTLIASTLMDHFPGQVDAQNEVLAPMAAHLLGRQGGAKVTVEQLPSYILRQNLSNRAVFRRENELWRVYDWSTEISQANDLGENNVIYQTNRAAKAAAWLVANQLYSPALTVSVIDSERTAFIERYLIEYLEKLARLFPPIKFHTLNPKTMWLPQAQGPVLVTFNFEEPTSARVIRSMDVIYRTGWGETRHQHQDVSDMAIEADKLFALSHLLNESCGVTSAASLVFFTGAQPQLSRSFVNLMGAINARYRSLEASHAKSLIDL